MGLSKRLQVSRESRGTRDPQTRCEGRDMGEPQLLRDVLAEDPLLLTAEAAAKTLSISRTTLYTLIKVGALRPVHIGRSCRLSRAELQRYVDRLETSA